MIARLDRFWRLIMTGFAFVSFGIGGGLLGAFVLPTVHLTRRRHGDAERICRRLIHQGFRFFLWFLRNVGVLSLSVAGRPLLQRRGIIVANHPSLIDVILIVAQVPNLCCVVKKGVLRNPFMAIIARCAGYVPSNDPEQLLQEAMRRLSRGETLLVFPEGTRSQPGGRLRFKRGVARIIRESGGEVVPVRIAVVPNTLMKGAPWYAIPAEKPHFSLTTGVAVSAGTLLRGEFPDRRAIKRCTEVLQNLILELQPSEDSMWKS